MRIGKKILGYGLMVASTAAFGAFASGGWPAFIVLGLAIFIVLGFAAGVWLTQGEE